MTAMTWCDTCCSYHCEHRYGFAGLPYDQQITGITPENYTDKAHAWDAVTSKNAELIILRTQLAEAESRALQAVAREAELVGALTEFHEAAALADFYYGASPRGRRITELLSSTSPRAKQLLAIVAAARELRELQRRHGIAAIEERITVVNRLADDVRAAKRKLDAALTTHPTEENSR